jgi:hypothetical protein
VGLGVLEKILFYDGTQRGLGALEKRKFYDGTQSGYGRLKEERILPRNPQISGCLGEMKSPLSCRDSNPDYQVAQLA